MRFDRWQTRAGLLALLLTGFGLRVHDLGRQSLWLDEAYTWGIVVNTDWINVWTTMLLISDVSPLAYVITKLTAPLFGNSEFGLRVSSVFFGWLAVPVMFRVGQAMFGRPVGMIAALFVACSPFAVWYAQDARPYGLYLFLGGLVMWGFQRAERGRGWLLLVGSSAALYLTHYVSALFVYAQAAYILTQLRRQPMLFRQWALAQMVAVIPVGGWVLAFLLQRRLLTGNTWIPRVTLWTPFQTIWNFVSGDAVQPSALMALGLLAMAGLAGWGVWRSWQARGLIIQLLLWWLGLPLLSGWLFSLRLPVYIDRFFEPALLALALLLAAGIAALPGQWAWAGAAFLAAGLFFGSARLFNAPEYSKEDWRAVTRAAQARDWRVGVLDAETILGMTPYVTEAIEFEYLTSQSQLTAELAKGPFVMVWRSPHESAHALGEVGEFVPLQAGPPVVREWLAENPSRSVRVEQYTGLALVVIDQ